MSITGVTTQLRTTDLAASIDFYTSKLGFELGFQYEDFYAGIKAGDQWFHLKRVDEPDPTIRYIAEGEHFHLYFTTDDIEAIASNLKENGVDIVNPVHETPWGTKELSINDNQGYVLYFSEML